MKYIIIVSLFNLGPAQQNSYIICWLKENGFIIEALLKNNFAS